MQAQSVPGTVRSCSRRTCRCRAASDLHERTGPRGWGHRRARVERRPRSRSAIAPPRKAHGARLLAAHRGRRSDIARGLPGERRIHRARAGSFDNIITEALESRLLGRGGEAFPAGRKWDAVATQAAQPHYIVCNADESEPGTFKDRVLSRTIRSPCRGDDHRRLATRTKGYLYIRGEYPLAEERVATAHRARATPGFSVTTSWDRAKPSTSSPPRRRRLHLRRGDGALQLDRGQARRATQQAAVPGRGRPVRQADRRQQRGDAGQRPPHRPRRRGDVRGRIGTAGSTGPRLFCLSGHVARPGVYEVEFGATLRTSSIWPAACPAAGSPGGAAGWRGRVFVGPARWTCR